MPQSSEQIREAVQGRYDRRVDVDRDRPHTRVAHDELDPRKSRQFGLFFAIAFFLRPGIIPPLPRLPVF